MSWTRGADEIAKHIAAKQLDVVLPSREQAARLNEDASLAIASAKLIAVNDPGSGFALAYDAARKAATSLLALQSLRPTAKGGHLVVQSATSAQFGEPFDEFARWRRRRHAQQYPDATTPPVTADDASEAICYAERCLAASTQLCRSGTVAPWK